MSCFRLIGLCLLLGPLGCLAAALQWTGIGEPPAGWDAYVAAVSAAVPADWQEPPLAVALLPAPATINWDEIASPLDGACSQSRDGRLLLAPNLADAFAGGAEPMAHGNLRTRGDFAKAVAIVALARRWDHHAEASKDPQFRRLAGWGKSMFGWSPANKLMVASPDPREWESPEASFAIHSVYFLLDPEYACRRPAMQQWFATQYGDPFPQRTCKPTTYMYLINHELTAELAPNRVAAVHYLLAAPGTALVSGWGHTLLRLVPPAADGTPDVGNVAEQTVLGYQALTMGDLSVDHLGGLTGKYPTLIFPYLFTDVYGRYVAGELRELKSFPLELTDDQRRMFLSRVLEQYWCYEGSYKFVTRNCATEAREDLATVLGVNLSGITPGGVRDSLGKHDATNLDVLDDADAAVMAGLYFPEIPDAEDLLKDLRKEYPAEARALSASNFIKRSTADERAAVQLRLQTEENKQALTARFYELELAVQRESYEKLFKEAAKLLRKSRSAPEGSDAGWPWLRYQEALEMYETLYPWNLVPTRYGVPLAAEVAAAKPQIRRKQSLHRLVELKEALIKLLRADRPEEWQRNAEASARSRKLLEALAAPQ